MKNSKPLVFLLIMTIIFLQLENSNSQTNKQVIQNGVDIFNNKLMFNENMKIINLGPKVNSKGIDYAPAITLDGNTLIFVSNRVGSMFMPDTTLSHDFWAVKKYEKLDTVFMTPYNLDTTTKWKKSGLNTTLNEGAACISSDGKMLFFTGCNRPDGYGSCDIYVSAYTDGKWTKPVNLGLDVNSRYFDSQPSIAPYNRRLYFTSTRKGPNSNGEDIKSNMDIWYCDFNEETQDWLPAVNLEAVNTKEIDCAPFIGPDGLTLFISSKGHQPNFGGLDFYYSKYDQVKEMWSSPENLGKLLNTPDDDQFLTIPASGDIIYFSSQRKDIPGYQGNYDIFMAYVTDVYTKKGNGLMYSGNFPNPFSKSTTIKYTVPKPCNVKMTITDVYGKSISVLFDKYHDAGDYNIVWEALSESGQSLSSGIYFYNIIFNSNEFQYSETQRMLLMR